jgi:hypothetical protein
VILFSLGCSLLLYICARRLTERSDIPVLAALLMTVLPVSVFFGRNVQPDSAALFFSLLSTYFFLEWTESEKGRCMALAALSAVMAVAIKGTFIVMLTPLLFIFPWKEVRRRLVAQALWLLPGLVLLASWLIFTKFVQSRSAPMFPSGRLFLAEALTVEYWRANLPLVWKYVGDNFTYIIFFVFLLDLAGRVMSPRSRLSKYLIGSAVSAVLYFLLISDFAVRHSYYHIPFLPMICLGAASALSDGRIAIEGRGGRWARAGILVPLLILLITVPFIGRSLDMHFDKQMIGCDVAGRYIGDRAGPEDRIFISYGAPSDPRFRAWRTQYYGILWEANRRGVLLPASLATIELGERERSMRWIVMFRPDWKGRDKDILDHIHANYSIRQAGYADGGLLYYLLEKGGSFDPDALDGTESDFARSYSFSNSTIDLSVREAGL